VNFDSGTLFVDASENRVGIGTTTPAYTLEARGSSSGEVGFGFRNAHGDGGNQGSVSLNLLVNNSVGLTGAKILVQETTSDAYPTNMLFYTNGNLSGFSPTERMRIDSSGNVLVGTTSASGTFGDQETTEFRPNFFSAFARENDPALGVARLSSNGDVVIFRRETTTTGSISVTSSTTAYNTSSDYRLKENVQPITGALAKVQALNPVHYNWKVDGSEGEGFIAHELQEIVPYAVTGEKDGEEMQGVDYSKLTTLLTAAIKELTEKVESLEAQLEAK